MRKGFSSEKDAKRVWVMDAAKKQQINVELHSSNLEMEVLLLRELHQRVPCGRLVVRIGYHAWRIRGFRWFVFLAKLSDSIKLSNLAGTQYLCAIAICLFHQLEQYEITIKHLLKGSLQVNHESKMRPTWLNKVNTQVHN